MSETQTTIVAGGDVVTVINAFVCAEQRQDALVAAIDRIAEEVFRKVPGFISLNVHASLDRTRVVNYLQFESVAAMDAALERADVQDHMAQILQIADGADPRLFTVRSVHHI